MSGRTFLGEPFQERTLITSEIARNIVGRASERLVARLLGAQRWSNQMPPFDVPESAARAEAGERYGLTPDLWWGAQSALVEVKGGISRFFATERQWRSYLWARDTAKSGLPVEKPRVFYAFVSYAPERPLHRCTVGSDVLDALLGSLQYVLVADSRLVELYLEGSSHRGDQASKLADILGNSWAAHWSIRCRALQRWADHPRKMLDQFGLTRWRGGPLAHEDLWRQMRDEGWHPRQGVPCVRISPCRRERRLPEFLPGGETMFVNDDGLVPCPNCGVLGEPGDCASCGAFTAF